LPAKFYIEAGKCLAWKPSFSNWFQKLFILRVIYGNWMEKLFSIAKAKGISENELVRAIQKKYVTYAAACLAERFMDLEKLTGVEPHEKIQRFRNSPEYEKTRHLYRIEAMLEFSKKVEGDFFSNIECKISEEVGCEDFQEDYAETLKKATLGHGIDEFFEEHKDITNSTVQAVYRHFFRQGELAGVCTLYCITGIAPEISRAFFGEICSYYISNFKAVKLQNLKKITKQEIRFDAEQIQKVYLKCIPEGRLRKLLILREMSGIEPSEEVYEKFIDFILHSDEHKGDLCPHFDELGEKDWQNLCGIAPHIALCDEPEKYRTCLSYLRDSHGAGEYFDDDSYSAEETKRRIEAKKVLRKLKQEKGHTS
jgi:hypothetical protein